MVNRVSLVGNPNTGKTTIFNTLTKLRHHTGNWAGKTVDLASGKFTYENKEFEVIDLPGTYTLNGLTDEEKIVKQYIVENLDDLIVVVLDATCLERGLNLLFEVLEYTKKVIVAVNLVDEARRKNIILNRIGLSYSLGLPVVFTSNKSLESIAKLKQNICNYYDEKHDYYINPLQFNSKNQDEYHAMAKSIVQKYVHVQSTKPFQDILINKPWNYIIMSIMLIAVLFITIKLSNYPSTLLEKFFDFLSNKIFSLLSYLEVNVKISGLICDGILHTLFTVVAVMLPPMAIFFPLFGFLEDLGVFPRIAYNTDYCFKKCGSTGKQALTMCMGFGCNASAIVGTRIIESPKQKLIAIITNSFIPCNGRFPLIIFLSTLFFKNNLLVAILVVATGIFFSLLLSYVLSKTILKSDHQEVTLEFPPYRIPNIKNVLTRTLLDKTLVILMRAVVISMPIGAVIWILNNIYIDGTSLSIIAANYLNPFGILIGLDGIILLAFILAFPANEIVLPLIIMMYQAISNADSSTITLLLQNSWTFKTALCTMLFSLLHAPCSTTLLTIYKETKSKLWTVLAFVIPTLTAIIVCFIVNIIL